MKSKIFETSQRQETVELGRSIGNKLIPGSVICITGDLGAGKTAFTSGIAEGLGVKGYITSPTFTIVNEYDGKYPLFHFDVYRVNDPDELYEIGFTEYFLREGIVCIEWADLITDMLPETYISVEILKSKEINEDDIRIIKISGDIDI